MANYPNSAPAFTTRNNGDLIDASHPNELGDEITAIGTALLTGLAHGLTTNGQIVFPSSQNASGNANTLDDYEEGTSTTAITLVSSGGGTPTYGTQTYYYVKIGQQVWVGISLVLTNKGTLGAGTLTIAGLPFTIANSGLNFGGFSIPFFTALATSVTMLGAYTIPNTATLQLTYVPAAGATATSNLAVADINNTFTVLLGGTYRTTA